MFLALLLPGCVFVFLKLFGSNEFAVEPLFQNEVALPQGCPSVTFPYHLHDSIMSSLKIENDSVVLVVLRALTPEGDTQVRRIEEEFKGDAVHTVFVHNTPNFNGWKKCIFLLKEPFDLVLVDKVGTLRGQYISHDREDIDRLLTELAIILKKY